MHYWGTIQSNIWFLDYNYNFDLVNCGFYYPDYDSKSCSLNFGGIIKPPFGPPNASLVGIPPPLPGRWVAPDRSYLDGPEPYNLLVNEPPTHPFQPQLDAKAGVPTDDYVKYADGDTDSWDVAEQRLLQNTYPGAKPALAWHNSNAVVLCQWDRNTPVMLPDHQATEIQALHHTPNGWVLRDVTNDTSLDSQPSIAEDKNGKLVAVWTRVPTVLENDTAAQRLAKSEIAFSTFNDATSTWASPTLLTMDGLIDIQPSVVRGGDNNLYLVWVKSPDNVFPEDLAQPVIPHTSIWTAKWNGAGFDTLEQAVNRADTLGAAALAVDTAGKRWLAWAKDADSTDHKTRIFTSGNPGTGWSTPTAIDSTSTYSQSGPAISIAAGDVPVLFYGVKGLPDSLRPDHTQEGLYSARCVSGVWTSPSPIVQVDELNDLNVLTTPGGNVSAVWCASSTNTADIWTTIYDAALGQYSNRVMLTNDSSQERHVAAAWDPQGNPSAVYAKVRFTTETAMVQNGAGELVSVPYNQPQASDLYILSHRPYPDLAVTSSDIVVTPSGFNPGDTVSIQVTIRNLRALAATGVNVRFYDGYPGTGGAVISTVAVTPDPVVGGSDATATTTWRIPTDGKAHTLYVWVDPDNNIIETTKSNNLASYGIAALDLGAVTPYVRQALPDGRLALEFGISNRSSVAQSGNVQYQLWLGQAGSGIILSKADVIAPAPGQTATLTYAWTPTGVTPGVYSLTLEVDPAQVLSDANRNDNTAQGKLALLCDLALNQADPIFTRSGSAATVSVTVQNIGLLPADNVIVSLQDGLPGMPNITVFDSKSITSLASYGSERITLTAADVGKTVDLWIVVNPTSTIPEVRRDNNMVLYRLPASAYLVADIRSALRNAAGLELLSAGEWTRLNVEQTGSSYGKVDLLDALRIARKAAGLEANP